MKAFAALLVAAICLDVALAPAKRLDAQGNRRAYAGARRGQAHYNF